MSTGTLGSSARRRVEHLHAVHLGHREVGQDDVGTARLERAEPLVAALRGLDGEARVR